MLISKQISISVYIIAVMMVFLGVSSWMITSRDRDTMIYFMEAIDQNSHRISELEASIQRVNKDIWVPGKKAGLKKEIEGFSALIKQMELPEGKLKLEQMQEIENEYLLLLQTNRRYKESEKNAILHLLSHKQVEYFGYLRRLEKEYMTASISQITKQIWGARAASIAFSSFFFFLVLYVGYFIKHKLENAVAELKSIAKSIENGNYSQKVSFKGDTEFSSLGKSLNQLAGRAQQAEIIEKQNLQLGDLNRELKLKNDSLDSFVYRVSHDLKAPVINIQSLLKVINKQIENIEDEILKKTTFFMGKTTEKLEQTIFDLLEVSRIERNLTDKKIHLSFKDLMDEIINENRTEIERVHVNIIQDFEEVPEVYFSRINMKSVMSNLLTNAIKYHSKDRPPKVEVSSHLAKGFFWLTVSDNGVGVDLESCQGKIFGMFNRFHNHVEGSGVGLYIVKKIVDENGGQLEMESVVDRGTTVRICFPYEKTKADPLKESAFA